MMGLLLQVIRTLRLLSRVLREPEGRVLVGLVGVQLLAGTVFYTLTEGWKVLDSLYFCVTTLATVGLGDLAPTTDAGKAFTILYIVTGVGLVAFFLNLIAIQAGRTQQRPRPSSSDAGDR